MLNFVSHEWHRPLSEHFTVRLNPFSRFFSPSLSHSDKLSPIIVWTFKISSLAPARPQSFVVNCAESCNSGGVTIAFLRTMKNKQRRVHPAVWLRPPFSFLFLSVCGRADNLRLIFLSLTSITSFIYDRIWCGRALFSLLVHDLRFHPLFHHPFYFCAVCLCTLSSCMSCFHWSPPFWYQILTHPLPPPTEFTCAPFLSFLSSPCPLSARVSSLTVITTASQTDHAILINCLLRCIANDTRIRSLHHYRILDCQFFYSWLVLPYLFSLFSDDSCVG